MSFIAKLMLGEEEMDVLHCAYGFTQVTNSNGKPTGMPRGGSINLILESNGSVDLFDWMITPTLTKSGIVTFFRNDNMIKSKTLEFTDAYCVNYYETFSHQGTSPMQIQLTISAHKIKLNNSEFINNWPK